MIFPSSTRRLLTAFFAAAISVSAIAQAPQLISYQAVVRDAAGEIVKNRAVNFRLSVLDGGSSGTPQYVETQSKTTNAFGLVTFGIGQGATVSGSMNTVTWATGSKFLKVELDINGGNNFSLMSASQFLSVPYALYAASSGNGGTAGWALTGNAPTSSQFLGTTNAQDLRFFTNNSQKAVLTTDGNLGIGTPSPSSKLTIETNASGFTSGNEPDGRIIIDIKNTSPSSASQAMLKIAAGNGSNFTLLSHSSPTYTITPDSDNGQLWSTGANGLILRASPKSNSDPDLGSIRFMTGWVNNSTGSLERMKLDNVGNLGIGTSTPKAKVEVANGDVYLNDATKGIILKSPNGNCWRVTVDNSGNLIRTQITCPQ